MSPVAPVLTWVAVLGLSLGLSLPSAEAAKKGKKGGIKANSAQQLAGNLVMGQSDGVQNCAGKALDRGANKVEVYTKVTINSKGQIVAITTSVTVDKPGQSESVKQCVDGLLYQIKFPPIQSAPLTTIERTWTIATS